MKTQKIRFLLIACTLAWVVMACEKEVPTGIGVNDEDVANLNALPEDTSITVIADIVVEDSVLQKNASVSQCSEDFLTYSYDRGGRLAYINYIRRNALQPGTANSLSARYVYMRDKFVYSNTGKLAELVRFGLTYNSSVTGIITTRSYKYNKVGKLAVIVTRTMNRPVDWVKTEYLYYDNLGNMVEKIVNEPVSRPIKYIYSYDKENNLTRIALYRDNASGLQFICDLFYDSKGNIERKEFFYPRPWAASVNDVVRKWVVFYRYDDCYNPFRDFKLPVSSLFEWMDVISPANITAISLNNDPVALSVHYKYRYNNLNYPVLRYRTNLLPLDD